LNLGPGLVSVLDLGSKTGTFVNNQRIASETRLLTGDLLVVGDTSLQLTSDALDDTSDCTPALRTPEGQPSASKRGGASKRGHAPPAAPSVSPFVHRDSAAHALAGLVNTTLGYFSLGPVLGVGQHGAVFRALDTREKIPVALKVFVPEFSTSEEDVQRFIRAARTIMPLRYLHLVDFYNAGRLGGSCWVSMELIEGPSVAWYVQQAAANQVDWKMGLHVLRDACRALIFLHGKRVLHRNLTPENLMVCAADGLVKVADLITAKAREGALSADVTGPGHVVGDLRYLAPERTCEDPSAGDERSDLYSLGAVVYAVLAGRPPLEAKNSREAIDKIRHTVPTPLRQVQPAVPAALEAVVMRLLEKDPVLRFDDAKALLRHLVERKLMD
jgi:serine/threonine-protein kinase